MHISIIDDEKILSEAIGKKLRNHGYSVSVFTSYRDFMRFGAPESQLYIVDVTLGDGSGFDIVRWLRRQCESSTPIIMISGHGDNQNVVYGLDIGADDYLVKPFQPEVLLARVRAVLRRPVEYSAKKTYQYRDLTFDVDTKVAHIADRRIQLTRTEGLLLECLLSRRGRAVSRERIVADVWGTDRFEDVSDNVVSATFSHLRRKL